LISGNNYTASIYLLYFRHIAKIKRIRQYSSLLPEERNIIGLERFPSGMLAGCCGHNAPEEQRVGVTHLQPLDVLTKMHVNPGILLFLGGGI
jgi:hypothetical protein